MRKAVYLLSLTTAFFATTTAWLLFDRHRDAAPIVATAAAAPDPGLAADTHSPLKPQQTGVPPAAAAQGIAAGDAASPAAHTATTQAPELPDDPTVHFARQFLARYNDSAHRLALMEEARTGIRRQYSRLREKLRLDDASYEQLVTLLAEQNLQSQETWARCTTTPGCDLRADAASRPADDRSQELLALLGDQGMAAFTRYRESIGERDAVAQFRGRLSDSTFLPEAQAEQLITALAEERALFSEEVSRSGAQLKGFGTNLGMIWYPDGVGSVEQQIAEATQYSQRLRARAAGLLTPAQLAAYVQLQQELLAQLSAYLQPVPRKSSTNKLALRD
jgi:hypothetical protein